MSSKQRLSPEQAGLTEAFLEECVRRGFVKRKEQHHMYHIEKEDVLWRYTTKGNRKLPYVYIGWSYKGKTLAHKQGFEPPYGTPRFRIATDSGTIQAYAKELQLKMQGLEVLPAPSTTPILPPSTASKNPSATTPVEAPKEEEKAEMLFGIIPIRVLPIIVMGIIILVLITLVFD